MSHSHDDTHHSGNDASPNRPSERSPFEMMTPEQQTRLRKLVHDLNGELFLIRGYTEMSLEQIGDNERANRNLKKMLDRANTVEQLIHRLREFIPPKS